MNAKQLIDNVLQAARFQPTEETREALTMLLIDNYNAGESAYVTAQDVCELLEVDRKEFSYQIELVLRPEFNRN
jgi:hypothetical protein